MANPAEQESIRSSRAAASRRRPVNEADIDRINADLDNMEEDDLEWAQYWSVWFIHIRES